MTTLADTLLETPLPERIPAHPRYVVEPEPPPHPWDRRWDVCDSWASGRCVVETCRTCGYAETLCAYLNNPELPRWRGRRPAPTRAELWAGAS